MKKKYKKVPKNKEFTPQISYLSATKSLFPTTNQPPSPTDTEETLIEIVRTKSFKSVQKYIFRTDIDVIASKSNINFWPEFLENFPNLIERSKIAENIIDKISLHDLSLSMIGGSTITPRVENDRLTHLKAETLLVQGENILNIILEDSSAPTALPHARQGVEVIESSYFLYQSIPNLIPESPTYEFFAQKISKTYEILCQIIESIENLEDQYYLFESALEIRKSNFPQDKLYLIDLLTKLGHYGTKLESADIKLKAIQYSEEAYNIICTQKLNGNLASKLCNVLDNLQYLYGQFGDQGKKLLLVKQIAYLKTKFDQEEHKDEENSQDIFEYQPILTSGIIIDKTLSIKQQIQTNVLDKIQSAAGRGKWIEVKFYMDTGVGAYLDEGWLKSQLKDLISEENYEIALMLCFEAINIGIMNAQIYNPLCAAIFCQQYPDLVQKIVTTHPEYFIDGNILRISYLEASKYSVALTGKKLEENDGLYNKYFENEMTPIIINRIKESILTPIDTMIKRGDWSTYIESTLNSKLTTEFISWAVGNNLSKIPDIFSIVRIKAFKQIVESIEQTKSVNFSPIQTFVKTYPELVKRIITDHPEFITNQTIEQCIHIELEAQYNAAHSEEAEMPPTKQDVLVSGESSHQIIEDI